MPKKPCKNSFYYYMLDFKEEQRKNGINYANMVEVAEAADGPWRALAPSVRAKYENKAKQARMGPNQQVRKYTSAGIPLDVIEKQEKERQNAEKAEEEDIIHEIKNCSVKEITSRDIYLMDVNSYCNTGSSGYYMGEFALIRFNLRDGIQNCYHELINPGPIPPGYGSEVKLSSKDLGLDMPDEFSPCTDYMHVLANIIDFLKCQNEEVQILPIIYTLPEKVEPIVDFITRMCHLAGEDESLFRVYKLDTMFFHLINSLKTRDNEGFPKPSLALLQLKKDLFQFNPNLGCDLHEERDKAVECCLSRVKRWIFTICDNCCPIASIKMVPGRHLPAEFDMEGILTFKEQMKARPVPPIAEATTSSAALKFHNLSLAEKNFQEPAAPPAPPIVVAKKRVHVPLRMPKTKFMPADLDDEEQFPSLGATRGLGRKKM